LAQGSLDGASAGLARYRRLPGWPTGQRYPRTWPTARNRGPGAGDFRRFFGPHGQLAAREPCPSRPGCRAALLWQPAARGRDRL